MVIKVLAVGVKKNYQKVYVTICKHLGATIPEMDLKEILWRNLQKIQFDNSVVKKKTNKF